MYTHETVYLMGKINDFKGKYFIKSEELKSFIEDKKALVMVLLEENFQDPMYRFDLEIAQEMSESKKRGYIQ